MDEQRKLLSTRLKGRLLFIRRFNEDGKQIGKRTRWVVRKDSDLPREMFFKIRGFLQQCIRKFGTRSLDDLVVAAHKALRQAGIAFGCRIKNASALADLYWLLDGKRLIAWQIHPGNLDKGRAQKLCKSKALLRWVVVLSESGFFKIIPLETREDAF